MERESRSVSIRVLGGLKVRSSSGRDISIPSQKAQALLGYLAAHSACRESREKLAALLWGDRFHDQALHSLRQTILVIRKALGEPDEQWLLVDAQSVGLDLARVEIDRRRFEALAAGDDVAALEGATNLYGGDLLEGISSKADAFTEWLEHERDYLRGLAAQACLRLASLRVQEGAVDSAAGIARKALDILPTLEEGHRFLISLYRRAGNRSAALRQYKACEAILRRELDVDPELETRRLAEAIRTEDSLVPERLFPGATGAPMPMALAWARRNMRVILVVALFLVAGSAAGLGLSGLLDWSEASKERQDMLFPIPDEPSIVVLPFKNLNGDGLHQTLVDGISEEITAALTMVSKMFVIARFTALAYRDRAVDLRDVAKELGVRYVVEGTVQVENERVRVRVDLVDAIENRQLWAHRYESELTSLFAIQDRIALEVVTGLQVEIAEGEQERIALVHGTKNLQAWLIGGQALQHLRRLMRADNARARALYQQAGEIDPAYPGAWDGLAWTHIIDARFGWSPDPTESIRAAAALAERTLALDPGRPASYALLGTVALARGRHAEAIAFAEKAVALSPNGADVTAVLALILTYSGEPHRAVDLLRRAMRLSPYYPAWYRWTLGRAYRLLGDSDRAIAALMPADVPAGGSVAPLVELTASYVQAGKLEAARNVATRVVAEAQTFSVRAWVAMPPYRDAAVAENERALLGRAGLPD